MQKATYLRGAITAALFVDSPYHVMRVAGYDVFPGMFHCSTLSRSILTKRVPNRASANISPLFAA